jgi:DNA-binding CsgD family transcriptional regulator/tetratricopeptide (TPR) repeat protein
MGPRPGIAGVDQDSPGGPGLDALVGRDNELSVLAGLVDPPPGTSRALVVLGDAGLGKSALVAETVRRARSAGLRVLSVTARESEANLAFAGLHQLLRPVLAAADRLPRRQTEALRAALGLAEPIAADRLLTGIAVLTLLSDVSDDGPLLVVVDDVHWLDPSSLDVLAFVAHRLATERIVLVASGRGDAAPAALAALPELRLSPLPEADASRLLDRQPRPPQGRARAQVLGQAGGNPMALIALAKAIADDPAVGRRWAAEPLPLTDRLMAVIGARLASLPDETRAALLLAAVADSPDLTAAVGGGPGPDADSLVAAEELGLVTVDKSGAHFSHPLVRSAVYHSAPFTRRAAAHRALAAALRDQADRRAWHLAAAAVSPDEEVASLLEATAAQARRRGGAAAATEALERAAELSPRSEDRARRLVAAASAAVPTGAADWVQDLATRALAVTADPELRLTARRDAGWAQAYCGQVNAALATLIAVADEASPDLPELAWDALANAATAAYQSGTPASRQAVRLALDRMADQWPAPGPGRLVDVDPLRLWILACTDPFGDRSKLVSSVRQAARSPLDEAALWRVGSAAWLLDESDLAVRLLQDAMGQIRAPGVRGASGPGLTALGWVYIDTGRWDEALEVAAEAAGLAEANQMELVAASADVIAATVFALRADAVAARESATRALAGATRAESGLITARARRALGVAALAADDHLQAFTQLSQLWEEDGTPLHNYASYLGVADLAAAAVRADRQAAGSEVLERALGQLNGLASPRLEQLIARARGLLEDPAGAEAHFTKALADPTGSQWPFERAQLRLDYAEWLRRRRRINEAKPVLTAALETFRRLQARASARRAEAELRACGVGAPVAGPDALSQLTPQQRQIVTLASRGLTNREIADRLFLSPHTVSSHLYRSFPKLGITARHQLRDVVTEAGAHPLEGEVG